MVAVAYAEDVRLLAEAIASEYVPESSLYERLSSTPELDTLTFSVYTASPDARLTVDTLYAVQLVVDAAAVAVESADEKSITLEHVYAYLTEPAFGLVVVELEVGSVFTKLRVLARPQSRARLASVGVIAGVVLSLFFGPVPAVVGTVLYSVNELTTRRERVPALPAKDDSPRVQELSQRMTELEARIAEKEAAAERLSAEARERENEYSESIQRLEERVRSLELRTLDPQGLAADTSRVILIDDEAA